MQPDDAAVIQSDEPATITTHDPTTTRRTWGKGILLGATALGVLFTSSKPQEVAAAPVTDTWKLGGNANVSSDGTNFIGPTNNAPLIFKTANVERMRVHSSGNVGVGVAAPSARLQVEVANGIAVLARHTATTGDAAAVRGETSATVANASGVFGQIKSTAPGTSSAGVRGENNATGGNGSGVRGAHAGYGYGVHGTAVTGYGVYGEASYNGVYGKATSYGVIGVTTEGTGVYGSGATGVYASGTANGVEAYGQTNGVYGSATTGVYGTGSTGVYGKGGTYGIYGEGYYGVVGISSQFAGVYGYTSEGSSNAVYGVGGKYSVRGEGGGTAGVRGDSGYVGVWGAGTTYGFYAEATGTSGTNYGVVGNTSSPNGYAGYFNQRVHVVGTLSKGAGSFKIDHPLDPANKYLYHSFVESPDMKNIYDGVVVLDPRGEAVVTMPAWFEALNMEFRYQLTCIGGYAPVYIATEIANNRFTIAGGKAGMKVSWQVTGTRHDAFANSNRIPVEEQKTGTERGKYMHPEAFGKPATMNVMQQPTSSTAVQRPAPSVITNPPQQDQPKPQPLTPPRVPQ